MSDLVRRGVIRLTLVSLVAFHVLGCDGDDSSGNTQTEADGGTQTSDATNASESSQLERDAGSTGTENGASNMPSATEVQSDADGGATSTAASTDPSSEPSDSSADPPTSSDGKADAGRTEPGSPTDATSHEAGLPETDGGSDTTTSGTDAGAPPIVVAGCTVEGATHEGDSCTLSVSACGERGGGSANCSSNGDSFACSCSLDDGTSRYLSVNDVEGATTCAQVMDLCVQDAVVQFEGDYSCGAATLMVTADVCWQSTPCRRQTTMPNGLVVIDEQYPGVTCSAGPNQVSCGCITLELTSQELNFTDAPMSEACLLVMSTCLDGVPIVPTAGAVCSVTPTEEDDNLDYCNEEQRCNQAVTIGEEATSIATVTAATCTRNNSDWTCSCDDGTQVARFNEASQPESSTTCGNALALCDAALAAEITGPLSCDTVEDTRSADSCWFEVECSRAGEVGDVEVSREGHAYVSCDPQAAGSDDWLCTCSPDGGESTEVEITIEAGAMDACAQVMVTCQQAVDVVAASGGTPP